MSNTGSLSYLRILDFTGEIGPYAAKLYAGLGADVIHIEPIAGDTLRSTGPFFGNRPGKERSMQFIYYNAGKRGLVLDLKKEKGKEVFVDLCKGADILFESFTPGYLDELGLSFDVLSAANPKLVQTSITPFGSFGPYSTYPGSDLTCSALGGFLYLAGIDNDKPVRACDNQAYRMAEVYAAVGSSIALLFAQKTGVGQFVDVSCMEAVGMALETAAQCWDLEGTLRRGRGKEAGSATIHPCKDGFIAIVAIVGRNKTMWTPFVQWMKEEGVEEWELFDNDNWINASYRESKAGYELFCRIFERFTMKHTKQYLYDAGQAHRVAVSPVSNGKDLLENPQLNHHDFWQRLYHEPVGAEVVCPGAPYEFGHLKWRLGDFAPTFGQHTAEVLGECGYSRSEIDALDREGVVHVAKS
ncbi:succinyl:(R)-benzylsuccinate coenzyme A transferase subunit [Geobacter metallireducens GS-15]|uniref:Succinyl:(R)-benzylsuccinate coenzyme A transferase subunit n=1 Tax=Geobacter metallireducens (strain ATCC 53774 / DSM 7210 / GS-15) TaxID=269799 RepID=Q39VG9_GEOMG|nr:CoA transferase [Geobacter metallireducens]ABB31755.1 succinyl:(R)-benzylsuccinate coenzyme A transferase subunit [Geobacter metallireducens GS-15]